MSQTQRLRRFLMIVLIISIFAATLMAGYAFYSYRRPLPQTEGAIFVPGLQESTTVYRDDWGIPHIYAANAHDLFFAQGYVHAQDRWWQMEINRHLANGNLTEILGENEDVQRLDRFARTIGWGRIAAANWRVSSPESRAALEAYSAGVNAYLKDRGQGELAMQYAVIELFSGDYEVSEWQPLDTLAWLAVMAWAQEGNFTDELINLELGQSLAPDLLTAYLAEPLAPEIDLQNLETVLAGDIPPALLQFVMNRVEVSGQTWVVNGEMTASGSPLLASQLNMGIIMPVLFYGVSLHCIELTETCPYNVAGYGLSGVPGILAGHNDQIAWGLTNAQIDTQDLYVLKLNPDNPTQYEVDGQWRDFEVLTETVSLNDDETTEWSIYISDFGVIVSDDLESGQALALQWTAYEPADPMRAILQLNTAADSAVIRAALANWGWSPQQVIYADIAGNIGAQLAGRVPIRAANHSGANPVPGWQTDFQWQGFQPYDSLPHQENPPSGWIISPDQARLQHLLTDADAHTVESFALIQGDTYNPFAVELLPLLFDLDFSSESDAKWLDYQTWLQAWDFYNHSDSPYAALFSSWWAHLVANTFDPHLSESSDGLARERELVLTLPPDHVWWDDPATETIENRNIALRKAFEAAILDLEDQLGTGRDAWRWGDLHTVNFVSLPLGTGGLGEILNRGEVSVGGDSSSLNTITWSTSADTRYAAITLPTYRLIIDLSDFDNSRGIQATGQSGHPASENYDDMIDLWQSNQHYRMHWNQTNIQEMAVSTLRLRPGTPNSEE